MMLFVDGMFYFLIIGRIKEISQLKLIMFKFNVSYFQL